MNTRHTSASRVPGAFALIALSLTIAPGCEFLPLLLEDGGGSSASRTVVAGSYDASANYDVESASGVITQSAAAYVAPDEGIRDAIVGAFGLVHSSAVGDEVANLYGDYLAGQVRDYLGGQAPWVLSLDQQVQGVDRRLSSLDVGMGILLVEREDGALEATQIWESLSIPDAGCVDGEACETTQWSVQELLDSEYPVEIASSTFVAMPDRAGGFYEMQSHAVSLNYGRLGLYLLIDSVLPDEGDDESLSLRDVALAAVNCRGLAQHLTGDDRVLGWNIGGVEVGLSFRDVVGACQEGIFATVNDVVDQFSVPLTLTLSGQLDILDDDGDRRIDRISSSSITGDLLASPGTGAERSGPVSGVLEGWRVGDLTGEPDPDDNTNIDDGVVIFDGEDG